MKEPFSSLPLSISSLIHIIYLVIAKEKDAKMQKSHFPQNNDSIRLLTDRFEGTVPTRIPKQGQCTSTPFVNFFIPFLQSSLR